jgi:rubrerythrin
MGQTMIRDRRSGMASPVDDVTYDLMQALTSKLEAIEAYQLYLDDAQGDYRLLFEELLRDEQRHAEMLLEALRSAIG